MKFRVPKIATSEIFWLVLILLLSVVLRLNYLRNHPLETRDGILYLEQTRQWFANGVWQKQDPYLQSSPMLYCYLSKSLMYLGLSAESSTLCVNFVAGVALLIPVWLVGKMLFQEDKADALLLTLLASVCPKLIQYSCERLREGLFLFFSAWVLYLFFCVVLNKNKAEMMTIFCGICAVLAAACRYEALELIIFSFCGISIGAVRREKKLFAAVRYASLFLAGLILGFGLLEILPGFPGIFSSYYTRLKYF